MIVREVRDADVEAISRLYFDTVRRINAKDYSPRQIEAWAPAVAPASFWRERFKSRKVFVAEEGGEVIGFTEFGPEGHIDCFYVHYRWQGRGVGSKLLECIESQAKDAKINLLFAEVSITARPFFEHKGFTVKDQLRKRYRGSAFRLFLMEKEI